MIRFNPNRVLLLLMVLTACRSGGQAPNGAWVYPSATGNLLYQLDERGQRINDFSQCGYRGGTEPLPDATALIPQSRWVTVNPGTGDDTALVQAAIDSVEALTPDANGWRGVVLLKAGEFQLASTLTINASGVVLKGEGDSATTSTINLDGNPASTTLDLTGKAIGALANPITFNAKQGTLQNVAGINGTGGLTKTTAGTLLLAGTNTFAGTTVVSDGTLALGGSLAGPLTVNAGTFAPRGLPVTGGDLTLNASGTFQARINGGTAGAQYDQLAAGGGVTLAGPLDLVAGLGLAAGTGFVILKKASAGAISGIFTGKPEGSVFTDDGYPWVISYLGGDGNDVVVTLATALQSWRFTHFGTVADSGNAAVAFDANGDGEVNLLEFASGQNPHAASRVALSAIRTAGNVEVTFTRSKGAFEDGMTFAVEWSDTLAPNSWSVAGVTQSTLSDNGTLQSVKATIPTTAAIPRRFVRVNVASP